MFGKLLKMTWRTKAIVGVAAGLFLFGAQAAHGQVLFTTVDDFSGWGNNGDGSEILSTQVAPDFDASGVNGLGNTTTGPGNAGTPGSLSVTHTQGGGTYNFFYSQGEQGNAAFLAALGSSGIIDVTYTTPASNGGSYFGLGLVLNYTGNFGQFFGGAAVNDGNGWSTQAIPYTINTMGSYSYFQLGLIINSDYSNGGPINFAVDDIAVPEPASLSVLGLGVSALMLRRRKQRA